MNNVHSFKHDAMKTTFTLRIVSEDSKLAHDAAHACIELIGEIENKLSRYIEGSDVWQINQMQAGETLFLSDTCYDCLRVALDAYIQTEGLFDITLGKLIEHRKNKESCPTPDIEGQLMVDPERPAIHCIEPGREIDLGGIGKGFTLDRMKAVIQDYGIESAVLSSGASTQLAFGPKTWEIKLNGDSSTHPISLKNQALSASGTEIQGSHIISPHEESGQYAHPRIWLIHETASLADAWSTAAMLMNQDRLRQLATQDIITYTESTDGTISRTLAPGDHTNEAP